MLVVELKRVLWSRRQRSSVHDQMKWLPGSSRKLYQSTRDVVEKKCVIICNKEDDGTKKKLSLQQRFTWSNAAPLMAVAPTENVEWRR
jgi:hypothetical protein